MTNKSLTDDELLRYSRQVLLPEWDLDAQERLKKSQVIILGAGGLGCPAAETLARSGVGSLYIIDNDIIEASNLQRQTLFYTADIGKSKAQTAKSALQRINPLIQVTCLEARLTQENAVSILAPLLTQTNVLLMDCSDNFAVRELLNTISVRYQRPLLSASAIAMNGQLALYEPYKKTGCYHCVFGATFTNPVEMSNSSESNSSHTEDDIQNCSTSGVLASTTTVMGNLQANLALQYLGLDNNPIESKLLLWNGKEMTQTLMRYRQDPQCPVCANKA